VYKTFYNLTRNPFDISPDPAFLFATPRHNEALAALYHAVRGHKGFVVLTGEVGTGKTLLLRCVLQLFRESNDIAYAYVFNGRLSPCEFLEYIATDFGLAVAGKNKTQILFDLSNYVVARGAKSLTTVLVVDEAHHLSEEILEEIRLLTNLETPQEKLLQILLVGQPELDEKLDSMELRQLKQRIALRSNLSPLDLDETDGYIHRRLQLAGSHDPAQVFPVETVVEVHRHSHGIPRLINTLCENALIHGYAKQMHTLTPETIEEIALDFRLNIEPTPAPSAVASPSSDVQQAARTLLDLYSGLRQTQGGGENIKMMLDAGARRR
jgi:general secretion pathway protein A